MKGKWRAAIAALTAPTYIGGLGSYQRGLAEALEDFGVEGVFISVLPEHPQLGRSENPLPWPVKFGFAPSAWSKISQVMIRLAARPVLHPSLEFIVSAALPARKLSRLLGKVDWIHFVGTGRDYMGFALLRFARRVGVRFTVWPAVHPRSWGDDILDVRLYKEADAVMCQTNYEQRHLAGLGVPDRNLFLCGLPPMCLADGNPESIRRELDLGARPCVLFLGRRDEGKGYFALLHSWNLVLQVVPDACLLLGGPGDPHPAELAKLPRDSFRDLGLASERTKADALAACNLFCLPSGHESFGIAYVEAWSYAKPVICGTAPACRELIEDGKSGVWADQDPANLAEKIVRLLQQPELAKSMGEQGHTLQQERFSWSVVADTHLRAAGLQPALVRDGNRVAFSS
jgi:glycosyltransferase involved in cell wall biosynthesis